MIHTRTTGLLAAVLLSVLLLAGCGGGGGEPTVSQSVHDLLQHELDNTLTELRAERQAKAREAAARRTAEAQATRLTGELTTARAEAMREATRLEGERDAAAAEVERLEGLIGAATDVANAAESASLHARLNHATAEVTRLTGELMTATGRVAELETLVGDATNPTATSLRGQIAAEKAKADDLQVKLAAEQERVKVLTGQLGTAQAAVTEAEEKVEEAEQQAQQTQQEADRRIEEAEEQATVAVRAPLVIGVLGAVDTDDTATGADVGHMPGGRRTFTRPLNLPAKGSAPSVPGSWSSASYSGPRGNVGTDTVYLYSNIQAPSKRKFWQVYGADEPVSDSNKAMARLTTGRRSPQVTDNKETPDDATDDDFTVTYGGRFNGASGTLSCSGTNPAAACMLTNAETATEGLVIDDAGDGWTFTPSSVNNAVGMDMQDRTYLYFGIWAFEPTDPSDGTNPHTFQWAAGGDGTDITTLTGLTGTADFTGGAIGRYALAKVGGRPAKIGTFTAKATFSATFGDTPTISGRITEFKEGGSSLGSDWHVFLGLTASTAAELDASGTTGSPMTYGAIDGDNATGAWGATLHGTNNMELMDRNKYPLATYPETELTGIAGWFEAAAGTDAAIAGAFGAACTMHCAK